MVKSSKTTVWHLYLFFFQFIFLIFRWHATDCWSLSFDEGCHRIVTSRNGRHFFGLESWSSWLFSYWNHCQYSTVQGKLSSIFKNNGILLPKLFWPTVRKKCSSDREKLFKNFEITRKICSNSDMSEQFFFRLFPIISTSQNFFYFLEFHCPTWKK